MGKRRGCASNCRCKVLSNVTQLVLRPHPLLRTFSRKALLTFRHDYRRYANAVDLKQKKGEKIRAASLKTCVDSEMLQELVELGHFGAASSAKSLSDEDIEAWILRKSVVPVETICCKNKLALAVKESVLMDWGEKDSYRRLQRFVDDYVFYIFGSRFRETAEVLPECIREQIIALIQPECLRSRIEEKFRQEAGSVGVEAFFQVLVNETLMYESKSPGQQARVPSRQFRRVKRSDRGPQKIFRSSLSKGIAQRN